LAKNNLPLIKNTEGREYVLPSVLLGISLAAPVVGFQITYVCLLVLYLIHISHKFTNGSGFRLNQYGVLFAVFATLAGFFALYHYAQFGGSGDMYRTMELVVIFIALVMVLDALRYLMNAQKLSTVLFAKTALVLVPIFLVGRVIYLLASDEIFSLADLLRIRGSSNKLIPLNPNHLDNVCLFMVIGLGWALYTLFAKKSSGIAWCLVGAVGIIFFSAIYTTTNSLGGFIALVAGLLACSAVVALRQPGYKTFAALVVLVLLAGLAAGVVLDRHSDLKVVAQAKVFLQPGSIERLTKNSCQSFYSDGRPKFEGEFGIMPSASYRVSLAANAIKIWSNRPLLGYGGYDAVQFATDVEGVSKCVVAYFSHPHNLYMDILIRGGIIPFFFQ